MYLVVLFLCHNQLCPMSRQGTVYLTSKQLLLFAFARQTYTAMQRQKAVSAYFTSKQILPFVFVDLYIHYGTLSGIGCILPLNDIIFTIMFT